MQFKSTIINHTPDVVDWPIFVSVAKPFYETGPMYKSFVYIH